MKTVHRNSSMHPAGKPSLLVMSTVALAMMFAGLTALGDAIQHNAIAQATGVVQR